MTLIISLAFEFPAERKVDLAIAQSVFTHMTPERAQVCLRRMLPVMRPGAPFTFTYITDRHGLSKGQLYLRKYAFVTKRPPSEQVFRDFAESNGLRFETFNAIPHPSGQRVGVITF